MTVERRTLTLVLAGLPLILGAAFTSWFLTNFEPSTEQIPVGASALARRNDLLAAERLLTRLEVPVESVAGRDPLRHPPPTVDTLVVKGLGPLNDTGRAGLRAWLESGGHLVVEAMEVWDEETPRDDFLAEFGVRLRAEDPERLASVEDGEVLARVATHDPNRPLIIGFLAKYYLESDGESEGETDDGIRAGGRPRLVRRPVGDGLLTVVSDSQFMTNEGIGERDHAFFTAQLMARDTGGKVWLLYDSGMPWLGALLWSAAPHALMSAALLLAIWLWSLGGRLGPLALPPERRRRNLIEHLDAGGDFLWRHGRASHLVEASRRRILAAWLRRRPDLGRTDTRAQATAIAAATGQSEDRVSRALLTQAEDAPAFIEQGVLLQRLWFNARSKPQSRAITSATTGEG